MPYAVKHLIEDRSEPVSIDIRDQLINAFKIMTENDFSQLPVINDDKKPEGMITYESILRAEKIFKVEMSTLCVIDAMVKVEVFHPEDDLFDLLNRLKENNAVLIIDNDKKLLGIVTSYDTNEFFRRRSEDIMMLEDIEGMLKDLINAAHTNVKNGEVDLSKLRNSINEISPNGKIRKQFEKGIRKYMGLMGQPDFYVDPSILDASLTAFEIKERPQELDQLTLYEFNLLFLTQWDFYSTKLGIGINRGTISQLLDDIRESRNQLAHFRGELSSEQRERIRFCADWLTRHQLPQITPNNVIEPAVDVDIKLGGWLKPVEDKNINSIDIIPADEETKVLSSRYLPLAEYLSSIPGKQAFIKLTLEQIEKIIQGDLPASAYSHRSWWANDSVGHVQSKQWLEVGWRVSYINLTSQVITFNRIVEREKAYIKFYSKLIKELEKRKNFPLKEVTPDGQGWIIVAMYPVGSPMRSYFNFSFSRDQRFRVELYIDTGDKAINKIIYDSLYEIKNDIQSRLDEKLEWERMDEKRASRVALYHPGKITDSEDKLQGLRFWAAENMETFFSTIATELNKIVLNIEQRILNSE